MLYSSFSSGYSHHERTSRARVTLPPCLLEKLVCQRFLYVALRQTQCRFNKRISDLRHGDISAQTEFNDYWGRLPVFPVNRPLKGLKPPDWILIAAITNSPTPQFHSTNRSIGQRFMRIFS